MDATTIKQLSDDSGADQRAQQLKRIRAAIKDAALQGYYNVMMFEALYQENIDLLRSEDYSVGRRGGRMGDENWLIGWGPGPDPDDTKGDPIYYPASTTPKYPL